MAFSKDLLTDDEIIVAEFRPHWRMLFFPALFELIGIGLIIAIWAFIAPDDAIVDWITTGVVVVALVFLVGVPFVRWWYTAYILTNERLITRSGIIARSGIEMPLENINNVLFSQNLLERLLKSGDLLIESAGETGQSRFADIPDPEGFQALLYRVREERTNLLAAGGPGAGDDATAKLARLADLRERGHISDEEFESKKQTLLDEI